MEGVDRVVLVTRATPLQEAEERFATKAQARFVMERARAGSFAPIEAYEERFRRALDAVRAAVPAGLKTVELDRAHLPNYVFGPRDLVATLGPDGLVVNVAKYLEGQPILAFNPDPERVDGVLVPFTAAQAPALFRARGFSLKRLAMARVRLADGQELHAVNDLFLGRRTHVSARYRLGFGGEEEDQSSSGVIVSTGAGSTGWYRSLVTGAAAFAPDTPGLPPIVAPPVESAPEVSGYRWDAEADELRFTVREPFVSRTSGARLARGVLRPGDALTLQSAMPEEGAVFSDGIEEDYLPFDTGSLATITLADRRVNLVAGA